MNYVSERAALEKMIVRRGMRCKHAGAVLSSFAVRLLDTSFSTNPHKGCLLD